MFRGVNGSSAYCLVVDDDEILAKLVAETIRIDGHEVDVVNSGTDAIASLDEREPDLVILDLQMPDLSGRETAAIMRERSGTRILMLTARDDSEERVIALTTNVDDYMTKPFVPAELRARVQALLRRSVAPAEAAKSDSTIRVADLCVDERLKKAHANDNEISMTQLEFHLLAELARNFPEPVAKSGLIAAAWGKPDGASEHTLDVHLHRVRRKLADAEAGVAVASMRGFGFYLIETR